MASIVRVCEVISIDDAIDADRIKVRMTPEDNSVSTIDELPYCFPLLPKMLHVKPKVGEAVFVITANSGDGESNRYYIGPIISQKNKLNKDSFYIDATSVFRGSYKHPDVAPTMNPETKGAFLKDDEIGIEGRRNTGIQLTDTDARVKAGVKLSSKDNHNKVIFNSKNPSYLKLKYYDDEQVSKSATYGSTATIVADKINLIGSDGEYNVTDRDELITDEEMKKIIDKAHQLPYGDVLVEFLTLFRNAFMNHVHPFSTLPPCAGPEQVRVAGYDLNKILSRNVRIN